MTPCPLHTLMVLYFRRFVTKYTVIRGSSTFFALRNGFKTGLQKTQIFSMEDILHMIQYYVTYAFKASVTHKDIKLIFRNDYR